MNFSLLWKNEEDKFLLNIFKEIIRYKTRDMRSHN